MGGSGGIGRSREVGGAGIRGVGGEDGGGGGSQDETVRVEGWEGGGEAKERIAGHPN